MPLPVINSEETAIAFMSRYRGYKGLERIKGLEMCAKYIDKAPGQGVTIARLLVEERTLLAQRKSATARRDTPQ